jgi:transcriptional regulator with XRE-family HTH domain
MVGYTNAVNYCNSVSVTYIVVYHFTILIPMRERFDRLYQMVGDRVCKARTAIGMSQTKLSNQVGVNRVSIVNIEKGRQRAPLDTLWQIANVLGVELVQLIPKNADFAKAADGIKLDAEDLKAIQDATKGNLEAARQISDFVRRAKTRTTDRTS